MPVLWNSWLMLKEIIFIEMDPRIQVEHTVTMCSMTSSVPKYQGCSWIS